LTEHGSVTVSELADFGCIAAAADNEGCYAMLLRRDKETLLDLLSRLDGAIATAADKNVTVDEVNPPGGFKSTRP